MHMHWWQSIRWRLALGSMAVVILATAIMALSALLAIAHNYTDEQQRSLKSNADANAHRISASYIPSRILLPDVLLARAVTNSAPPHTTTNGALMATGVIRGDGGEDYLFLVLDLNNLHVYPALKKLDANTKRFWDVPLKQLYPAPRTINNTNTSISSLRNAVLQAHKGVSTPGEMGTGYLFGLFPHLFIATPIRAGDQATAPVIGVLLMIPRSATNNTIPLSVASAGKVVLQVSVIVIILAALAAILFARTITRPLAKVTDATRILASGDYSARVPVGSVDELGELARNFNDMATELQRDVEELRKQELWRRELIMSVTHDLATPLTAIAGLGEALVDGVNQSREDYEETGRIIVRETLRLRRLVKDLHMMAKVEAGALEPHLKPLRLAALADEVLAVLATEFERAHVEPRNMISYNLPLVAADPDMITRVFSNLCDNALQHTPPNGIVTIEAIPLNNTLAIAVTDTGQGIPPEALERVFERFFRADTARHSTTGGSGLGLAIVRAIVESHGGHIRAENAVGAGARFIFTLPFSADKLPATTNDTTLHLSPEALRRFRRRRI